VTSMATMISAVLGVIIGITPAIDAWDSAGLPTPATRGWIREKVVQMQNYAAESRAESRATRLDIANGKREAAERDLDKLELDVLKTNSEEEKVRNLQAQRRVKETLEKLKDQINRIETNR